MNEKITKSFYLSKISIFILHLTMILVFNSHCKKEERAADIAPEISTLPNISGQWKMQGQEEVSEVPKDQILFLDLDAKTAHFNNQDFAIVMDSLAISFFANDKEQAVGYFLFSEIKDHTWMGAWENRVVRLVR